MAKNGLTHKEIVLVLVSAVLGGIMSLYVFLLYNENNEILTNPSLKIFGLILLQAFYYIVLIGIVLYIIYLFYKFVSFNQDYCHDKTDNPPN